MTWTEGKVLGEDTRLVAEIDHTDGCVLWYARDAENHRDVMVEVASAEHRSDSMALLAFHAAAESAMVLRHPSLLSVFDHGLSEDGSPYVIREPMPATNVMSLVNRKGALGLRRVARIVEQVLRVLDLIQPQGLALAGVTPDNVFLVADDVKLWMQIVSMAPTDAARELGVVAPERRDDDVTDPRAALYEVAALAYYALTAIAPGRDFARVMLKGDGGEASRIELDAWFQRALHHDPEERFSSAREMLDAWSSVVGSLMLFVADGDEGGVTIVPPAGDDDEPPTAMFDRDEVTRALDALPSILDDDDDEEEEQTAISMRGELLEELIDDDEDVVTLAPPSGYVSPSDRAAVSDHAPVSEPAPSSRRTEFPLTRSVSPESREPARNNNWLMLAAGVIVAAASSMTTTYLSQPAAAPPCDCAAEVAPAAATPECPATEETSPTKKAAIEEKEEVPKVRDDAPTKPKATSNPVIWPTTTAPQKVETQPEAAPAPTTPNHPPQPVPPAPVEDPDDPYAG